MESLLRIVLLHNEIEKLKDNSPKELFGEEYKELFLDRLKELNKEEKDSLIILALDRNWEEYEDITSNLK